MNPTTLHIGRGLLTGPELLKCCGALKTVVIADAAIEGLYAVDVARHVRAERLAIAGGEGSKRLETAARLIDALCEMGCGRDTVLLALGGGVTTDLVGFVASVYMRGVPLILIPTTLLAIVDAAIGGKTAIDTPYGKNLIGTIYPPKAVFADLDVLKSLPEREWFNGFFEILKLGLVCDVFIWEMAKTNSRDSGLIYKAIEGKRAAIERDPTEGGLRRILNFGHTIGHGLEAVSGYEMAHGEAVAIGCAVEAHLSMQLGYLGAREFAQIESVYRELPLKLPKSYSRTRLLQVMARDKKNACGQIRFVLIDAIGHAIPFEGNYCRPVSSNELESTLNWMENAFQKDVFFPIRPVDPAVLSARP